MTQPTDVAIYFRFAGDLDSAAALVHRLTGAHSFRTGRIIPGLVEWESKLMSLSGTAYAALEAKPPGLRAGGPETFVESIDDVGYNWCLGFPEDPETRSETDAIVALAVAIGGEVPCVIVDGEFPNRPLLYESAKVT